MLWAWLDCNPDNADALTAHPDALPRLAALLSPSTLPPFREEDPEDSRDGRDTRQEIVQCAVGMWWGCSSRVSALAVRRALAAGVGDAVLALLSSGDAEGAAKAHFCASGTLAAWFVVAPAEMAGLWARAKGEAVGFVKHAVGCLLQGAGRRVHSVSHAAPCLVLVFALLPAVETNQGCAGSRRFITSAASKQPAVVAKR